MSPEDREKRIEAAGRAFRHGGWLGRSEIVDMLDAADAAVPVVSLDQHQRAIVNVMQMEMLRRCHEDRSELKQKLREAKAAAHPGFAEPSKPSKPDEEEQ